MSAVVIPDGLSVPGADAADLSALSGCCTDEGPDAVPAAGLEAAAEVTGFLFSDVSAEDVCAEEDSFARAVMPFPAAAGLVVAAVADGVFSREGLSCPVCISCSFAADRPVSAASSRTAASF